MICLKSSPHCFTNIFRDDHCNGCQVSQQVWLLKKPQCSMAMSAQHRSKFAALHRHWWYMSENFSYKQTQNMCKMKMNLLFYAVLYFPLALYFFPHKGVLSLWPNMSTSPPNKSIRPAVTISASSHITNSFPYWAWSASKIGF